MPFEPSILDVLVVREMLKLKLLPELTGAILDNAEYWPHTTTVGIFTQMGTRTFIQARGSSPSENLRTVPIGFVRIPGPSNDNFTFTTPQPSVHAHSNGIDIATFRNHIGFPVPAHPCRKIVFTIRSCDHDQGWSSNGTSRGTFKNSYTWFDAGLERFDDEITLQTLHTVVPPVRVSIDPEVSPRFDHRSPPSHDDPDTLPFRNTLIQANRVADSSITTYRVEWRATDAIYPDSQEATETLGARGRGMGTGDGKFVRGLKLGDVVTVWAKARYPGWSNHVESVKVDVYWALPR